MDQVTERGTSLMILPAKEDDYSVVAGDIIEADDLQSENVFDEIMAKVERISKLAGRVAVARAILTTGYEQENDRITGPVRPLPPATRQKVVGVLIEGVLAEGQGVKTGALGTVRQAAERTLINLPYLDTEDDTRRRGESYLTLSDVAQLGEAVLEMTRRKPIEKFDPETRSEIARITQLTDALKGKREQQIGSRRSLFARVPKIK